MQRLGTLLVGIVLAGTAVADSKVDVRGPRDREVKESLDRTLAALGLTGDIDVELQALTSHVIRYTVRVKRANGELVRSGIATTETLGSRISSTALLGLLAREPDRRRRLALVVDSDRKLPARAHALWAEALQHRGMIVISEQEVQLARSTQKLARTDEDEVQLSKWLGVSVISIQLRARANDVAIQLTVVDEGPRRGSFATVPASAGVDEIASLLETAPIVPRRAP